MAELLREAGNKYRELLPVTLQPTKDDTFRVISLIIRGLACFFLCIASTGCLVSLWMAADSHKLIRKSHFPLMCYVYE